MQPANIQLNIFKEWKVYSNEVTYFPHAFFVMYISLFLTFTCCRYKFIATKL